VVIDINWVALATIASPVLAIVGLVLVLIQIRQVKDSELAANRAYVSARVELGESRTNPALFLVLKNHGRSPARAISIKFDNENDWHYVQHWQKFPFIESNKITKLLPQEEKKYFLGPMTKGSRLLNLKENTVNGTITYTDPTGTIFNEPIELTLKDLAYVAR